MSKQDNLTDFLTDVADAIREKKGTSDLINPQNFSDEIRSIQSGGTPTAAWNDVNFYDYDGTILYSYTWDEFVAKNEIPPLPNRESEGLTCQEWNYTLEEVLEQGGRCDVGATYIPTNGRTQIYIEVSNNFEISFNITPTVADDVVMYWGDNTLDNLSEVKTYTITHTYENSGIYCIEIENIDITRIVFNTKQNIYRNIHIGNNIRLNTLALSNLKIDKLSLSNKTKLEIQVFNNVDCNHITLPRGINTPIHYMQGITSKTVSLPNNIERFHDNFFLNATNLLYLHVPSNISTAFNSWATLLGKNLRKISVSKANNIFYEQNNCMIEKSTKRLVKGTSYSIIPDDIVSIDVNAFNSCTAFNKISIPHSVTSIGNSAFCGCTGLKELTLPNSVENLGTYSFYGCTNLTQFDFEENSSLHLIDQYAFQGCTSITELVIPDSVTTIKQCAFYGCTKLIKISLPPNTTSYTTYTFYNCNQCDYFDFSRCNSVPQLVTTNAFTNTKSTSKIIVPDNLYTEWVGADNWSTLGPNGSNRIITLSDYNASLQ